MAVTGEQGSNKATEEMLSKGAEDAVGFWHMRLNRTVNVGIESDDIPGKFPIIARVHRVVGTRANAVVDEKGEGLHSVRTGMRWISKEGSKVRSDVPWEAARETLQKLIKRMQVDHQTGHLASKPIHLQTNEPPHSDLPSGNATELEAQLPCG